MKNFIRFFLGANIASLVCGLRFGPCEFIKNSFACLAAAHPFQSREQRRLRLEWEAIPEISLADILGARKAAIKLTVQRYEDGMLPPHEAMALLSILVAENPQEVLEIGTYMGYTAKAIAENLENAMVHTMDLPPDYSIAQASGEALPKDDFHLIQRRIVGREFKGRECEQRIVQHFGDTAQFDFAQAGRPTCFFIDGSHTYEYCKNDSEKCFRLCGGRGVFLWHDCDERHPGVLQFVSEWRSMGRDVQRVKGTAIAYWKSV